MEINKKGDKKIINAWTFYDWANSSYQLVITAAIFPIFYVDITNTKDENGKIISDIVTIFGRDYKNTELYDYVISLSFLILCLITPILSGIADYRGNKKRFMQFFCYLGALSCATLYFFNKDNLGLCLFSILFASLGYSGSVVFYNSYLPEIAEPEDHDKISAQGFAKGYFGSAILLIINLILIKQFNMPAKYSFITVAVWWAGFAQISFLKLPNSLKKDVTEGNIITKGFKELIKTWNELKHIKQLKRFLLSFFIYSMGVQTVMLMAVMFAKKEIKDLVEVSETVNGEILTTIKEIPIQNSALITSILIIQFLGIAGAYIFSLVSRKIGNIKTLGICLFIWIALCIYVYQFVYSSNSFYITASIVGLIMGGIQSLSRSTFSKLLPETDEHASYFSIYDVCEKTGIVIGMLSFGLIEGITGGMRNSILALITFFITGFIILLTIPKTKNVQ